jgi:hypothetical protein
MNSNELALGYIGDRVSYRDGNKVTRLPGLRRRRCSPAFAGPLHLFTVTKCPALFVNSKPVCPISTETDRHQRKQSKGRCYRFEGENMGNGGQDGHNEPN